MSSRPVQEPVPTPAAINAVALLQKWNVPGDDRAIHLDLGCGLSRLDDEVRDATGAEYLGVPLTRMLPGTHTDGDVSAVSLLAQDIEVGLARLVGERRIASISVIEQPGILASPRHLKMIAQLARTHRACVVLQAANLGSRETASKLLLGQDAAETSSSEENTPLLGQAKHLSSLLSQAGLRIADSLHVEGADTASPAGDIHPALTRGTPLGNLFDEIVDGSNPFSGISDFVWLTAPASAVQENAPQELEWASRPFLTVVMRTQGRRLHTLSEALLCLSAQTDSDFEVLLIGHNVSDAEADGVAQLLADTPEELRERITFFKLNEGGRTRPLNVGFKMAKGHYIVILDDDDIPLAHWVETFRGLAAKSPGHLLRSACVRQDVSNASVSGVMGLRAIGPMEMPYPSEFDFVEHLRRNLTPGLTIAFPRGAVHGLGLRFDESLTTTEDWDFLVRAAAVCGVVSSPKITSIYRWWPHHESSRTVHPQAEWDRNREAVLEKWDKKNWVLPQGSTKRIRELLEREAFSDAFTDSSASPYPQAFQKRLLKLTARSIKLEIAWLSVKRFLYVWSPNRRRGYKRRIKDFRAALKGLKRTRTLRL